MCQPNVKICYFSFHCCAVLCRAAAAVMRSFSWSFNSIEIISMGSFVSMGIYFTIITAAAAAAKKMEFEKQFSIARDYNDHLVIQYCNCTTKSHCKRILAFIYTLILKMATITKRNYENSSSFFIERTGLSHASHNDVSTLVTR